MKKLLSILGAVTLIASSTTTVVACGTDPNKIHKNPNYREDNVKQTPEQKELITEAFLARAKAAILTDIYHINYEQTRRDSFRVLSSPTKDLKKAYDTYFDEKTFKDIVDPEKIDLEGNLGYQGGIIDLIVKNLNLDSGLLNEILKLLGLDVNSTNFKVQVVDLINLIGDVVSPFDMPELGRDIPVFVTKIPPDFLHQVPQFLRPVISDVVQSVITTFVNHDVVTPVLEALIAGTDLTKFENQTIVQLFDSFAATITNFVAYGLDPEFTTEFDDLTVDYDQLGQFWFDNQDNLNEFNFETNLSKTVEKLMSLLAILNCLLTAFKTVDVKYADDQHLFDDNKTNDEMTQELFSKTLSDTTFGFDLKHFPVGSLVSNLIYFLSPQRFVQQNFQKFLYLLFYHPDNTIIPAFWKLSFALIKADENSSQANVEEKNDEQNSGDDGSEQEVKPGVSAKLVDLYTQTIGPRLLNPIVNNQQLQPIEEADNPAYAELIQPDLVPGLKPFFEALVTTLGTKPMEVIYSGDLTPVIDSIVELAGEEWTDALKDGLKALLGTRAVNANNLLGVALNRILGLTNIPEFPTNEAGLVPDYAGYYTNKTLKELVDELATSFKMNGWESPETLINFKIDFQAVNDLLQIILYDNHQNVGKGLLADLLENLVFQKPILELVGYNLQNLNEIYQDSVLGKLMLLFVPELETITNNTYDLTTDFDGKQDNFGWFFKAAIEILTKVMSPTEYTEFIRTILLNPETFEIKPGAARDYAKTGNIRSREYIITYNFVEISSKTSLEPPRSYELIFESDTEVGKYQIKTFRRLDFKN